MKERRVLQITSIMIDHHDVVHFTGDEYQLKESSYIGFLELSEHTIATDRWTVNECVPADVVQYEVELDNVIENKKFLCLFR